MTTQETATITTYRNKPCLLIGKNRTPVRIVDGPWIPGVDPDLIKVRPACNGLFPQFVRDHFSIENNSDMQVDYFESDCIRLLPGNPLWKEAKNLA